jgi:hypothetical protein
MSATLKQIPQVPAGLSPDITDFMIAVKQCLEVWQGNIGSGEDVIRSDDLPNLTDITNIQSDWDATRDEDGLILNKPVLGTASTLDYSSTLTDSANLVTGAGILAYARANWESGIFDNITIGTQVVEAANWNALVLGNENPYNFAIYDGQGRDFILTAIMNQGVALYYGGDKKFETLIDGISVIGDLSITGDIEITGTMDIDDFTIGTQTIDAASWNAIQVTGERNFTLYNGEDSAAFIGCYREGGVFLYYDGDRKFETTTNGSQTVGYAQFVDDPASPTFTMKVGQMTLDASDYQAISIAGAANFSVYDADNSKSMIWAERAGAVKLYNNGSSKIETTTTGGKIIGYGQFDDTATSPTYSMKVGQMTLDASPYQAIAIAGAANFSIYDTDNSKTMIWAERAGAVKLYYNGTSYLETFNGGVLVGGQIKITGGTPGASKVLTSDADGLASWSSAGSGDVVGPGSATDNAICRFDATTGKLIQNSGTILDDSGNILFTSGGEPVLNNNEYYLCKDTSGNHRYGLGLTSSNYWQLCRDGVNVSIGYGCSDSNAVMIHVNGTEDVVIERSAYTDGAGKHYLVCS